VSSDAGLAASVRIQRRSVSSNDRRMRTVSIPISNTQRVEVFVEKREDFFEVWMVGVVKERRMVLDHHLTHDDLEGQLEYARSGDLIWRDADRSQMPAEKHENAGEMEDTIRRGVFWDGGAGGHFDSMAFITKDRKALQAAKRAMPGRWTDGTLTFRLEPEHKLDWSCSDEQYWLNRRADPAPDWWDFNQWQFPLMSRMGTTDACGIRTEVIHVGDRELHLRGGHPNRMAHVFRRDHAA
jgi:hypothetical protein